MTPFRQPLLRNPDVVGSELKGSQEATAIVYKERIKPAPIRGCLFCVAFAPLFLKGNWHFSGTGKPPLLPPFSVGSLPIPQDLLYESTVFPHRETGVKRWRKMVAPQFGACFPKDPPVRKNTTDSKFTIRSKFATAIVKHYGGHFETTIFKGN